MQDRRVGGGGGGGIDIINRSLLSTYGTIDCMSAGFYWLVFVKQSMYVFKMILVPTVIG